VVECTALEMRHRCKPIGGSNPSLSARLTPGRDTLFQCSQPFDEPFLAGMLLTNRVKSTKEVLDRASLLGDRLKIDEKPRRLVVGRSVAPFDFGLDLAPDAFIPPRYRQ
jgi:hypothetical protein